MSNYLMLEQIIQMVGPMVGVNNSQMGSIVPMVLRTILQNADPSQASSMLSGMPSSLTSLFSNEEKNQFTTTQQNISTDELVKQVDKDTGINDMAKSNRVVEEVTKMLQGGMGANPVQSDDIASKIKGMTDGLNPFG